jgi:NitT/TauT family transport system substrate-binding protein
MDYFKMRRNLAALVAGATLLAVTACGTSPSTPSSGSSTGAAKPDAVKVGVIAIVDVAPIYLGKKQGFFSQHNIDLSMEVAQGGAAIIPGITSGQFQFGFSNVTSLMLASSKGAPLKIVCNGVNSTGIADKDYSGVVVKADSPIKTAKDLAGKNVSVNTLKNIGDTTVRASVRKAGGDPKAVKFVELAFPDAPPALQAGRVDAIWVVEPFLSAALAQGGRLVASNYVDAAPDLTVAAYFTSKQVIESKADLVKRFTEAMQQSLEYAGAHPDEVRAVLSTYTKITPEQAAKIVLPKWPAQVNRQSLETLAGLSVGDGLLDKAPDLTALLP